MKAPNGGLVGGLVGGGPGGGSGGGPDVSDFPGPGPVWLTVCPDVSEPPGPGPVLFTVGPDVSGNAGVPVSAVPACPISIGRGIP